MKIAVILLTLLLLNSIVGAEEAPTPPAPGLTIGAFGGPVFRFVNLKDEIRTQAGGRAALIFNHALV